MNKIGMHIHILSSEAYEVVKRLQPGLVTIMDPTAQWIRDLRAASPGTYIVGRRYEDQKDFWQRVDPGEYARMCQAMVAPQLADGWIAANEPFGHDDHRLFEAFDQWQAGFVVALRELGMEGVVNCFGTGNFTGYADRIKITEVFPRTCEVARVHGPHDYDWPSMDRTVGGRCLRWVRWLEDLKAAGIEGVRVAVGECGLTQATYGGPDIGWQTLHDNLMIAADLYLDNLRWYNQELVKIPQCVGCATFDWAGSAFGWPTFEHLIPYLIDGIEELSAEPTENGGSKMFPRVFNIENVELFGEAAEDLVRYHGLTLQYPDLANGEKFFNLVKLEEREGPACFIFTVLKEDGTPWVEMQTAWGWTDMGEESNDIATFYPTDWKTRADIGLTNENGNNGPGFGQSGWWHDPYKPGPGRAWIRHPSFWSVYLEGIGMEGGTNHRTMYATWQIETYAGEEPPPPEPEPPEPGEPGEILTRLERIIEDAEWVRERLVEVDALAEELADAL